MEGFLGKVAEQQRGAEEDQSTDEKRLVSDNEVDAMTLDDKRRLLSFIINRYSKNNRDILPLNIVSYLPVVGPT